jgi:hypothetical protein
VGAIPERWRTREWRAFRLDSTRKRAGGRCWTPSVRSFRRGRRLNAQASFPNVVPGDDLRGTQCEADEQESPPGGDERVSDETDKPDSQIATV